MSQLAALLEDGAEGVDADHARAVDLDIGAVEKEGDDEAMRKLALLLEKNNVTTEPVRATELYRRAIEGGHEHAIVKLAEVLSNRTSDEDADGIDSLD